MLRAEKVPEPWHSFLAELDDRAAGETRLDCMGGFVVTQFYGFKSRWDGARPLRGPAGRTHP